ncbi:MAG: hypothetical protein PHC34_02375 [Candidatus Gastranaerophilales bacterium]|nr:hypothetical protein [Candidatus Gastranaerophilales bacterium]
MKKISILLILLMMNILVIQKAEAKWWIFGQGNDGVTINYLYLNKNSYDELGNKVVIYKDSMKNEQVTINGKASVKSGKIGAVYVSKDNQQTWEDAKLSDNGSFQYSFKPETDQKYDIFIKILDTTAKKNNIEETHKELTVINENISNLVKENLDAMIKSYENEESNLFMSYVSPEFAGDEAVLDSAIRKDFNAFDYIKIDYFINNISKDPSGKMFLSIQYNRTVVSTKSGQTYSDNGNTEFVFKNEEGRFKLFSMKNPLIFGLSDAGNVATGKIQSTNNNPILIVDSSGVVDEKPFREAIDLIENDSDLTNDSETGTNISLHSTHIPGVGISVQGFKFSDQAVNLYDGNNDFDLFPNISEIAFRTSVSWQQLAESNLNSIHSVPETGYSTANINAITAVSKIYAIKIDNGQKYAIIKIKTFSIDGTNSDMTFDYKYQTNGTRNF